jgi:hypothetical protein
MREPPKGLLQACPGSRHQKTVPISQGPGRTEVQMVALEKAAAASAPPGPEQAVAVNTPEVSLRPPTSSFERFARLLVVRESR